MVQAKRRLTLRDVLTDGRIALMLPLGFSSGLPFLLVFSTLSTWLREAGISLTLIGLMSWVGLAYSFKFLWAPIVDRYDVPVLASLLGRRRGWMLVAQLGVMAGLVGMALTGPLVSLPLTIVSAVMIAFFSATQDVVIDGWRIDAAPTERQGMMAASLQLGYRLALLCAGAGALYIAELASWPSAYLSMGALMGVGLVGTLLAPRIDEVRVRENPPFVQAIIDPLADLFQRKRMMLIPILALIACYRLPDFMAGIMANPLYIDLGFSKADIANISKLYGVWIGIVGAFSGGLALTRIGLWWTLLIGACLAAGSNVMFSWLAAGNATLTGLTLTISIDNFAQGFAGAALIAYMSGLTSPGFAATQYALLSSLYALPGKLIGGASGAVVDAYGYSLLFTGTAALGIPLAILCMIVRRDTLETVRKKEEAEAREASAPMAVGSRA
ncbi:AmpG family muropeptide MFS transporter [Microvirga guangxiensis]|uniref:MFS transporter, PAT family, beta-lactamase induction signal transducer AmpG n=1 Tax=Microvirga guangxiensis TaxID=549386 RepID=A0A1G5GMR7_9HYPH|nr:MFS transporter [Microvirga guangxiensis]SCY52872.1 MFS transporter, PAT family, beta-lactamase induction signal transducer AmpG [Microvirga guangxiensis]